MTAYEELKAWCEKYLSPDDYKIVPESEHYLTTIYLAEDIMSENNCGVIMFNSKGAVTGIGAADYDDMYEHINDYEGTKEKEPPLYSPPPNSIAGQMVRKMIEEYERRAH